MSSKKKKNKADRASLGTKANPGDPALVEQREEKRLAKDRAQKKREEELAAGKPASQSRRFFAYLIDWYLSALCTALPVFLASQVLINDGRNQNLLELPAPYGVIAGVLGVVFACLYYIVTPLFVWEGQTPGKRLCGIKIVDAQTGEKPTLANLMLRQVLGVLVIEGALASASAMWHQVLTLVSQVNIVTPLMYAGFAITTISGLMVVLRKDRRCIHDFLGGTMVVSAPKVHSDKKEEPAALPENVLEKKLSQAIEDELKHNKQDKEEE